MSDNVPRIASLCSRNFHARLFQNILALDDFLDAVLSAEGKRIQVHRFVLAAGSKYFYNMLHSNDNSSQFPIFVFTDIRFEHMKRIVQYLYTGKTQIRSDELDEFFRVAKQLEILGLHHEISPGDLSVIGSESSEPNTPNTTNDQVDRLAPVPNNTSSEEAGVQIGRQRKRSLDLDGRVNNSTNNPEPASSRKTNDRKRARVEKATEPAKGKTVHLPKSTDKIPPGQSNGTSSKRNRKTVSNTGARNDTDNGKVTEKNDGNQQNTMSGPSTPHESNDNEVRDKKKKSRKTKEFQCETCRKLFSLRIRLHNHYKNSTCEPPPDNDETI